MAVRTIRLPHFTKTKSFRISAVIVLLLALYGLAGFLLVPRLLRSALLEDIPKTLPGIKPNVGQVHFNPFLLQLEIKDFSLSDAGGEKLLDGGLIANAPDVIALGLLQRRLGRKLTDCHILSIGTCAPRFQTETPRPDRSGKAGWIVRRRNIVEVTLDSQEKLTVQIMNQLLGSQFLRIDSEAVGDDAKHISSLDVATPQTTEALKRLADHRFTTLSTDPLLLAYL